MTEQRTSAWEKYKAGRLPGDISRRAAFDAGWDAAMSFAAEIAEKAGESYGRKKTELYRKPGEGRAASAEMAADVIAEAIRVEGVS